jgi:16S rRNA (guanine966-N2)-methyltransferase
VIGGELRGRRLRAAPCGVRPTSDRVRESLFAALGDPGGAQVLDLYAGAGTLGIEALSRGAERAVFVERSARSLAVLRRNLAELGLQARARTVRGDAAAVLARWARHPAEEVGRFDLALLDPPYASGELDRALDALLASGVLSPRATVVVESSKRHAWGPIAGLVVVDERRYGDTRITRLELEGEESTIR